MVAGGAAGALPRRADGAHRVVGAAWGPWERAVVRGDEIEVDSDRPDANTRLPWRKNLRIEVDVQPRYVYLPGTDLRLLRAGVWTAARIVHAHTGAEASANTYIVGGVDGAPREAVELGRGNHAPLLEPSLDLEKEHLKYSSWVRSTYALQGFSPASPPLPAAARLHPLPHCCC